MMTHVCISATDIHNLPIKTILEDKKSGIFVEIAHHITSKYDIWDMEYVFDWIKDIAPQKFVIVFSTSDKPFYNTIIEIRDALDHFAEYVGIDTKTNTKIYRYYETMIYFPNVS